MYIFINKSKILLTLSLIFDKMLPTLQILNSTVWKSLGIGSVPVMPFNAVEVGFVTDLLMRVQLEEKPNYCDQCPHARTPHSIKGYQLHHIYPATDLASLNNVRSELSVFINATAA